jgi:hypothetical protein
MGRFGASAAAAQVLVHGIVVSGPAASECGAHDGLLLLSRYTMYRV